VTKLPQAIQCLFLTFADSKEFQSSLAEIKEPRVYFDRNALSEKYGFLSVFRDDNHSKICMKRILCFSSKVQSLIRIDKHGLGTCCSGRN
jgi:hypothetical protein